MHTPRMRESKPLRGHAVVVTRPVGRGAGLARAAAKLGANTLHLPGSSLRAVADVEAARAALRAAKHADAVVFSSPSAVCFALRIDPSWRETHRQRVLAVGPATARRLLHAGIKVDMAHFRYDSEGLLASTAFAGAGRVAVVGAPAGRQLLESTLRARGITVDSVHVYRRAPARLDRRHLLPLQRQRRKLLLLLSSVETVSNLRAALAESAWQKLTTATVIASSARVRAAARSAGLRSITIAASALSADLLAAAVSVARGQAPIR